MDTKTSVKSPDTNATGFLNTPPAPLRYDGHVFDPIEVAGLISLLVPEGARVLDVGCGAGSLTKVIAQRHLKEIIGIEPDAQRAEIARQRGLKVVTGFLDDAFFADYGKFDVVVLADVLEHLSNPQELLAVIESGLAPGGSLVISVPNVAHWSVRFQLLFGNFTYASCGIMDATHLRWFTRASLLSFLAESGFVVMDYKTSAGTGLAPYYVTRPWCWMSEGMRRKILSVLSRKLPGLFGCQHVVRAVRKKAGEVVG